MRKNNTVKATLSGLLILAGVACVRAPAAEWRFPSEPATQAPVECRVRIPDFELKATAHGMVVVLPGGISGKGAAGAPDTPVLATSFRGDPRIRLAARFIRSDFEDMPGVDLAPVPSRRTRDPDSSDAVPARAFSRDAEFYAADAWQPEVLVLAEEAWMGTNKVMRVECRPFQYNAARKILRVHRQIDFFLDVKND